MVPGCPTFPDPVHVTQKCSTSLCSRSACKYQTGVEVSVSAEHSSLLQCQINSSHKRFCFIAKVPDWPTFSDPFHATQKCSTSFGSRSACKYQTRVEVSVRDKHSSLLCYQTNNGSKSFCFIAKASCCLIFSDPFQVTQKGAPLG
jgi:hypothetical protein